MRRLAVPFLLAVLSVPSAPRAQQGVNPIHPVFAPLDAAGRKVRTGADLSVEKTCGACHDAAYVAAHSDHARDAAKASCVQCHLDGGRLDVRADLLDPEGRLRRDAIRIGTPRAANCATCHGLVFDGATPVRVPADFEAVSRNAGRTWSLTQGEGAIVSPQRMSDSFLNLEGKGQLSAPWDVHAAKLVDCVACHYAANNPTRTDAKHATLRYLSDDPRRQSTAEFLVRPDHRLAELDCRGCHDPLKAHGFLPYRNRHMEVLACQACHVSAPVGPVVEMVDATVATADGAPSVRYRNVERQPGESMNVATIRPFQPLLTERVGSDGLRRLGPVNTVARWRWISGVDRAEVPFARVAQAYLDGDRHAPEVLSAFDADGNGRLDEHELRLDTKEKTGIIAGRLRAAGVEDPTVEGTLDTYPLSHGISTRDRALRDCSACHAADSLVSQPFAIAGYLPGGTPPRPREKARVALAGVMTPTPGGGLELARHRDATPGGLHVLGYSRHSLTNRLGFYLFVAVFAGVVAHGLGRFLLRKRRGVQAHPEPEGKEYVFGLYERIWHWTMALAGILLLVTGLEIHRAGGRTVLDLTKAVALHNVFAVVLMVNAFLALFYHLATAAIRGFIPHPHGLLARVLEHVEYQSRGIFLGGPHPSNAPGHKLNPLQQLTYLALLNVLFPLQIVTGILIWAVGNWSSAAAALGGLQYVAPLHNAGAWLFLSFFVLHVYLVTTGRTPTEHLESMVTGYQPADAGEPTP
jgi:thiosulfate reductase cytochrome b subunit